MFGIGETELLIIILFGFMVFGPDKLPGMGRTLGRALRQFRSAQEGFTKVVQTEIVDPATEMMNLDAAKPNRNRAAEFAEDADIETDDSEDEAPRKETFAERKARLAAERAAAKAADEEAAAKAEEEAAAAAAHADAEASADAEAKTPSTETPAAPAPKPKPAMPKKAAPTAAAELYDKPIKKKAASKRKAAASEPAAVSDAAALSVEDTVDAGKEDEAGAE